MSRSLDGPVCKHDWNLFNPTPCPRCAQELNVGELTTTLAGLGMRVFIFDEDGPHEVISKAPE